MITVADANSRSLGSTSECSSGSIKMNKSVSKGRVNISRAEWALAAVQSVFFTCRNCALRNSYFQKVQLLKAFNIEN